VYLQVSFANTGVCGRALTRQWGAVRLIEGTRAAFEQGGPKWQTYSC